VSKNFYNSPQKWDIPLNRSSRNSKDMSLKTGENLRIPLFTAEQLEPNQSNQNIILELNGEHDQKGDNYPSINSPISGSDFPSLKQSSRHSPINLSSVESLILKSEADIGIASLLNFFSLVS